MASKELTAFVFESKTVRTVRNGKLWWVLADVCQVLELGNVTETAKRLDDDEKGFSSIETLGGQQQALIVNEKRAGSKIDGAVALAMLMGLRAGDISGLQACDVEAMIALKVATDHL